MAVDPAGWYRDTRQYLSEVQSEYKKITWPAQKEAVAGTVGVLIIVTIVTTVLGLVDLALSTILQIVLR